MRSALSALLFRLYRWSRPASSPPLTSRTVGKIKIDTFANGSIEYSSLLATYPAAEVGGAIST